MTSALFSANPPNSTNDAPCLGLMKNPSTKCWSPKLIAEHVSSVTMNWVSSKVNIVPLVYVDDGISSDGLVSTNGPARIIIGSIVDWDVNWSVHNKINDWLFKHPNGPDKYIYTSFGSDKYTRVRMIPISSIERSVIENQHLVRTGKLSVGQIGKKCDSCL